ncbi:hypothetical protein KY362_02950, partial [Candidatus Woesearchaeota archaeon]|nr:hypothetical protein [Candidatus Woesearchaeota archaeon]
MVGETVFNGALLLLLYYLLIRVFALDVIVQSTKVVQLFIISNQYSSFSIAVCIFLFTFGRALKEYGIWLLKREHAQMTMAKMKERYRFMHDRYGAEVMPRPGPGSVHHPALPEQPHPHHHPQHRPSHMAPLHREASLDSLGHKPGHKPHEMHNAHKKHKKQR